MEITISGISQELADKLKLQNLVKEGVSVKIKKHYDVTYDNEAFASKILEMIIGES